MNFELMIKVLEKRIAYLERALASAVKEAEADRKRRATEVDRALAALNLKFAAMDKVLKVVMKEVAQEKKSMDSMEDKLLLKSRKAWGKENSDMQNYLEKYMRSMEKDRREVQEKHQREQDKKISKEVVSAQKQNEKMIQAEIKKAEAFARKMQVDARLSALESQMKAALSMRR